MHYLFQVSIKALVYNQRHLRIAPKLFFYMTSLSIRKKTGLHHLTWFMVASISSGHSQIQAKPITPSENVLLSIYMKLYTIT